MKSKVNLFYKFPKKKETFFLKEQIRDPCHRALFSYWKGRAFNIFPEYDKRATDYLSKAALLQPSNVLTLNELGESYAKNGEFEMAANCFKNANSKVNKILFSKKTQNLFFFVQEKNRFVLRNLSIVTRQLASKVTDRTERNRMIEEGIQYAKQAVELDVKDGASWCKITFFSN
jgi:tetratricopeptide (TPR) repeat protein